jgi:succinate dehydrogenase / fumarate reductase cytochrome b subunit
VRADGRRGLRGWVDTRGRRAEMWAFVANRISALILVGYLFLHLAVLSLPARGPSSWNVFLWMARLRAFLVFDLLLILAVLWHALNGVRVAAVGTGVAVRRQRALLGWLTGIGVVVIVVAGVVLFGEG